MSIREIMLDLDNAIVHSMTRKEYDSYIANNWRSGHPSPARVGHFRVFERPNLDLFLSELFRDYDVSVWSMGTKEYVDDIVDHVFARRGLKPKRVLTRGDCNRSTRTRKQPKAVAAGSVLIDDRFANVYNQRDRALLIPSFDMDDYVIDGDHTLPHVLKTLSRRRLQSKKEGGGKADCLTMNLVRHMRRSSS